VAAHARLRAHSPITQYAVAAALEALGADAALCDEWLAQTRSHRDRHVGCVNYSRRFLRRDAARSDDRQPVGFSRNGFQCAGQSHRGLAWHPAINYTLVGDPGTFVQGLALAADWLSRGEVDGCLVVGAEEN